jgi:hypothetical protein
MEMFWMNPPAYPGDSKLPFWKAAADAVSGDDKMAAIRIPKDNVREFGVMNCSGLLNGPQTGGR